MPTGPELWDLLFDRSPFPGLVTSSQTGNLLLQLNPAAGRLFHAKPRQLLGLPLHSLLLPELLEYGCLPESQAPLARIVHAGPSCGNLVELYRHEFESPFGPRHLIWLNRPQVARHSPRGSPLSARTIPVGTPRSHPATAGPRVLVAEDDPVNRMVIGKMLLALGCTVEMTADGQLALDRFAHDRFDIVLLDCHMPLLDGISAAIALRARGVSTPLVALTADVTDANRDRCAAAGFNLFLTKPISPHALGTALQTLLPHFTPHPFDSPHAP